MRVKTLLDKAEVLNVIASCEVCFVAMTDMGGMPYVLPFNFGIDKGEIYLHSGTHGLKIDILKQNPNVCIAFSTSHQLAYQDAGVACSHFMKYKSALVHGKVEFIDDYESKIESLNIIMKHYTGRADFKYNTPAVNSVLVFKVLPEKITGKSMGY